MSKSRFSPTWSIVFSASLLLASPIARAGDLGEAVNAGDLARVKALIASGANVNERAPLGEPLDWAASNGSVDISVALINAGANLEAPGPLGSHPLHFAAMHGRIEVAKLLIGRGATIDALDDRGRTPLITATLAAQNFDNVEMVKLLLLAKADPKREENTYHMTPLHFAAAKNLGPVAQLLLDAGVDVNLKDGQGDTPLHHASADGRVEMVKFLIVHGADVNASNDTGETPLKIAQRLEVKDLLTAAGARQ
jgi:ankyrin repeat protein